MAKNSYVSRNANSVWALNHCIKILKNEQKRTTINKL